MMTIFKPAVLCLWNFLESYLTSNYFLVLATLLLYQLPASMEAGQYRYFFAYHEVMRAVFVIA